ncbi:MAG: PDZ domain-containing protein [Campylobacterales bacterium]|nr:PDZ domain-containing protein [Campylobacterales bacterium]
MFRLFFLTQLLLLNLLACKGGYSACIDKINDSYAIQKNSLYIPVKNNHRLVYTSCTLNEKILKHDPFLGLYLVQDRSNFFYDFNVNMRLQLGYAVVDKLKAVEGRIIQEQVGLNTLANFSESHSAPALLLSSCCSLEGIVTPQGIIQKEYIERFVSSADVSYGDVGIRVRDTKKGIKVIASDPFMKNNSFKKGDVVFTFDGRKIHEASALMKTILFSKIGSTHKVVVLRDAKKVSLSCITQKRFGGGQISDTFLESKGIYFDKELRITKLSDTFSSQGLLVGDKLMRVNGVNITTQAELREYIEDFKEFSLLLFERNNFQFFVNIK